MRHIVGGGVGGVLVFTTCPFDSVAERHYRFPNHLYRAIAIFMFKDLQGSTASHGH